MIIACLIQSESYCFLVFLILFEPYRTYLIVLLKGKTDKTANSGHVLVLLADRFSEYVYLDMASLFSKPLLGNEFLFISMQDIEKGHGKARGRTQTTAGGDINGGMKLYSLIYATKLESCPEKVK